MKCTCEFPDTHDYCPECERGECECELHGPEGITKEKSEVFQSLVKSNPDQARHYFEDVMIKRSPQ